MNIFLYLAPQLEGLGNEVQTLFITPFFFFFSFFFGIKRGLSFRKEFVEPRTKRNRDHATFLCQWMDQVRLIEEAREPEKRPRLTSWVPPLCMLRRERRRDGCLAWLLAGGSDAKPYGVLSHDVMIRSFAVLFGPSSCATST